MSLRSDNVTKGAERAPNRSLFYAMGYTKEELERPLIGVVSAHSEIVPGHFHLDKIADAVKAGAHAGNIVRAVAAVCGGKGGGRPDSAMAGAKDVAAVDKALADAEGIVAAMIKE